MIALRNIACLAKNIKLQSRQIATFSDSWKDRDEAAQKVYITRSQKQTMKKLLKKIQIEEQDLQSNLQEFQRRLKDIMRRYKIQNQTLSSEISNLHKQLTQ